MNKKIKNINNLEKKVFTSKTELDEIDIDDNLDIKSNTKIDVSTQETENLKQNVDSIEEQIENLKKENSEIKKIISETIILKNEKEKDLFHIENQIEFLNSANESLTSWKEDFTHSFSFQLMQKMSEAKLRLEQDEKSIKKWLSDELEVDTNFVKRMRNWFVKRYLISFSIATMITAITILLDYYDVEFFNNLLNNIGSSPGQIIFVIWIIFIIYFSNLLLNYSRQWSRHRRKLLEASSASSSILESIDYVRESRLRIDSLHPQIEQYLQIMSLVIHHPWKVPQDLLDFKSESINTEYFPESVDMAVPYLGNQIGTFNSLINKTVSHLFIKGWRETAFNLVVSKIAENLGNSMSIGEIDRDSRKNGLRNLLISTHAESLEGRNQTLESVAREKLKEVVPIVQKQVLPEFKLSVTSAKIDPLSNLEISDDLVEPTENNFEWDNFLTQLGGYSSPWSSLVFSNEGILRGRQEIINRSFILGSPRHASLNTDPITYIPTEEKNTRPVDLVLRVDLSSWCSAGEVKVFEGMPVSEIESSLDSELIDKNRFSEGAI